MPRSEISLDSRFPPLRECIHPGKTRLDIHVVGSMPMGALHPRCCASTQELLHISQRNSSSPSHILNPSPRGEGCTIHGIREPHPKHSHRQLSTNDPLTTHSSIRSETKRRHETNHITSWLSRKTVRKSRTTSSSASEIPPELSIHMEIIM